MVDRRIGIYHGRPASILRSDIDVEMPSSSREGAGPLDSFDPLLLLEAIKLTDQAEAFLSEM